jgi:hypothetical protein
MPEWTPQGPKDSSSRREDGQFGDGGPEIPSGDGAKSLVFQMGSRTATNSPAYGENGIHGLRRSPIGDAGPHADKHHWVCGYGYR